MSAESTRDTAPGVASEHATDEAPDSGWPGMDALIEIVHKAESEYAKNRPHGAGFTRPHNGQIRRIITAIWPIAYKAAYEDFSRARDNEKRRSNPQSPAGGEVIADE